VTILVPKFVNLSGSWPSALDRPRAGNDRCGVTRRKVAIVTGATSGIGAAVGQVLAAAGMRVLLVGRNPRKLAAAARRASRRHRAETVLADLRSPEEIRQLSSEVARLTRHVDVLVHCAGEYQWSEPGDPDSQSFAALFEVNVRAPYLLTQGLAPLLARSRGQVIFLNSSVVRGVGRGVAVFKATQHALLGLTDSLRQELNPRGVRVTSVFPGRTATPRMRRIYAREGKRYHARLLLRADDVARLVLALTELPAAAEVTDVHLRSITSY
jgi:NAD(P)-dependent dehydrogenase (short-subunit alcohol dehydrogenase family)